MASNSHLIEQAQTARRLLDALLENLQGIMFRFQAARNLMIRDPNEALRSLDDAINDGEMVLEESRDAIQAFCPSGLQSGLVARPISKSRGVLLSDATEQSCETVHVSRL